MLASTMANPAVASQSSPFLKPRVCRIPPGAIGSRGNADVDSFLKACGVNLDPWQFYVLMLMLMVDKDGRWAASEVGLLVARQNGKGEILLAYDLVHLFLFVNPDGRHKTIVHTSHEVKTNNEAREKLFAVIRNNAFLLKRVEHLFEGNTKQGVWMRRRKKQKRQDRLMFVARSGNSVRGFTSDVLICDEAQELSRATLNALTYSLTTIKNRQELYVGTVPDPEVNNFEVFEAVRDRGRGPLDINLRTMWLEWSPEGSNDSKIAETLDLSDEHFWEQANPSIDVRVYRESTLEEFEKDTDPGKPSFARERLSIWPDAAPEEVRSVNELDMQKWLDGEVQRRVSAPCVLAVSIGRGGGWSSICGAQPLPNGDILVQHLDTRAQSLWVPGELKNLREKYRAPLIVLDEKNGATILTDMQRLNVPHMAMNMSEVAAAFDLFHELLSADRIVHPPQEELTISMRNAVPRVMGRGQNLQTWDQGDPKEIVTPTQAVTLAIWGCMKLVATSAAEPEEPQRPRKIVAVDNLGKVW